MCGNCPPGGCSKATCGCLGLLKHSESTKRPNAPHSIDSLEKNLEGTKELAYEAIKTMLFPSMPNFLQHGWVILEIGFAIFLFVLTAMQFASESNKTPFLNVSMFLACLDITLATIDGIIHFGSTFYKYIADKMEKRGRKLPELPCSKWLEKLNSGYELVRTLLSEFLLYPLIISDIIGFVYEENYTGANLAKEEDSRRDFTLFIVSNLYLLISVHLMRLALIYLTIKTLNKSPITSVTSKSDYVFLTTQFGITGMLQILTSIIIVAAVGVKITYEGQYSTNSTVTISPFLWVVMVTGWYIPVIGILCFFFVNYYWIHEFSMSYFVDLMSMLQVEDFTEAVFHGNLEETANTQAQQLADDIDLMLSKANVKKYKRSPYNTFSRKILYPVKNTLLVIAGIFYNISFLVFTLCLFLSYDSNGELMITIFEDASYGITLFVLAVIALVFNVQTMMVINYWIIVTLGSFFAIAVGTVWKIGEVICCVEGSKRTTFKEIVDFYLTLFTG